MAYHAARVVVTCLERCILYYLCDQPACLAIARQFAVASMVMVNTFVAM